MPGRPKGIQETAPRNTAARKQAALAASEGITPLDVMLLTMRPHVEAGGWDAAAAIAKDAAPYVHPRLASTTLEAKPGTLASFVIYGEREADSTEEWTRAHPPAGGLRRGFG